MYFIVNKTEKEINIEDLKLSLGPHQAIDLDAWYDRKDIDLSFDFEKLLHEGRIEIKRKDEKKIQNKIIENVDRKSDDNNINKKQLDSIKQELMEEFKSGIDEVKKQLLKQNASSSSLSKDDIAIIMKQVLSSMPNASAEDIKQEVKDRFNKKDIDVPDSVLADIHARTVDNFSRGAKTGKINYDSDKTQNTIGNNINELEDLLE